MINALIIFGLQMLYVPLLTLRTTFVVKGRKSVASIFALLEAIIYLVSLGIVFSDFSNLYNIVSYVAGFAIGIYLGCIVEEKMALGYRCIHVNLTEERPDLAPILREKRFGVTTFIGEGINKEPRYRLEIVSHRKRENELVHFIKTLVPSAFIVSYEPTQFKGGYLSKQMNRFTGI